MTTHTTTILLTTNRHDGWRPTCSCGWEGQRTAVIQEASDEADAHEAGR